MAREEIDFKESTKTKAFVKISAHKQSMHGGTAIFKNRTPRTDQIPTYLTYMHDDKRNLTMDKNFPTFLYRLANSIILSS